MVSTPHEIINLLVHINFYIIYTLFILNIIIAFVNYQNNNFET